MGYHLYSYLHMQQNGYGILSIISQTVVVESVFFIFLFFKLLVYMQHVFVL